MVGCNDVEPVGPDTNRNTGARDCLGEDLSNEWVRDCKRGSFYANASATVNGEGPGNRYEDAVFELLELVESQYRAKESGEVMVDAHLIPIDKDGAHPGVGQPTAGD